MFFTQLDFSQLNWDTNEEETKKNKVEIKYKKRTDYCYDCDTDQLYTHAMVFKCSQCHKIILGA